MATTKMAFVSNRRRLAGPLALDEEPIPGPPLWGFTDASKVPKSVSPEGWCWSSVGDPGIPAPLAFTVPDQMLAALHSHVAQSPDHGILLHMHGAGVDTPLSLWRAAKLAKLYGDGRSLFPVAFSWACGSFSPGDYKEAARWQMTPQRRPGIIDAALAFNALLTAFRAMGGAERPIIMTVHSMGHRLLAAMLANLDTLGKLPTAPPDAFQTVVLCAADIESSALDHGGSLAALGRIAGRVIVTFNRNDPLMQASFFGNFFTQPLGMLGPRHGITATPDGTAIVEVPCRGVETGESNPNGDTPGHHYWHRNADQVADILGALWPGAPLLAKRRKPARRKPR